VKDFEQPGVEWGAFAKHSNRMALTYQKECVLYDVETDKVTLNSVEDLDLLFAGSSEHSLR
jgi:hypothetical protein